MAAPQAGQLVDGYRFKGGDPKDQAAWEPVTGDDYLSSRGVDPGYAGVIKGISEGRSAAPAGTMLKDPYWQRVQQDVARYDPTFDLANPQSRVATRRDFTSGKSAQNVTALNTVVGHLDHLDRSIDGLGNYAGNEKGPAYSLGIPLGPLASLNNSAAHALATASGTDSRYKDFETAKTAVANELTRVFRGTGGAEADIQGWMKQLDSSSSPQALKTVVRSMATLMKSRLEALGEQYKQGMGVSKDPITLLTPDKQAAYSRMLGDATDAPSPSRADQARAKLGVDPSKYARPKSFKASNGFVVSE